MPRSRATAETLPRLVARRTASRLNSLELLGEGTARLQLRFRFWHFDASCCRDRFRRYAVKM